MPVDYIWYIVYSIDIKAGSIGSVLACQAKGRQFKFRQGTIIILTKKGFGCEFFELFIWIKKVNMYYLILHLLEPSSLKEEVKDPSLYHTRQYGGAELGMLKVLLL